MKNINELNEKLDDLRKQCNNVEIELQQSWNAVFDDIGAIKDAIKRLDGSKDFVFGGPGRDEVMATLDFDTSPFQDCRKYFTEYMREHFIEVNFSNNLLSTSVGPSFIITYDGDVYDQENECIFVSNDEYVGADGVADIGKRDRLIEEYMESEGFYPGVFETDASGSPKEVSILLAMATIQPNETHKNSGK